MPEHACPNLIILAGPNGSGKTTFAAQILQHNWGRDCININADDIADQLGGWNDAECVKKAQKLAGQRLNEAMEKKENIIYETVFSHPSKLELIKQAVNHGYFIRLFFICTESPRINIDRVADRFSQGGHTVPGDKVTARYARALLYGAEAMRLVQRGYLYDNTALASAEENSFRIIFRTINGENYKLYMPESKLPTPYKYFLEDFKAL